MISHQAHTTRPVKPRAKNASATKDRVWNSMASASGASSELNREESWMSYAPPTQAQSHQASTAITAISAERGPEATLDVGGGNNAMASGPAGHPVAGAPTSTQRNRQ